MLLMTACSSGTTVADTPSNVTGRFQGTFENTPGSESGTIIINIAEDDTGNITGTVIFESSGPNCLRNSTVEGSRSAFSVTLVAPQSVVVTTTTTDEMGMETTTTNTETSEINYTLTASNNSTSLAGTYVVTGGETCSNSTGSGTVNLSR